MADIAKPSATTFASKAPLCESHYSFMQMQYATSLVTDIQFRKTNNTEVNNISLLYDSASITDLLQKDNKYHKSTE